MQSLPWFSFASAAIIAPRNHCFFLYVLTCLYYEDKGVYHFPETWYLLVNCKQYSQQDKSAVGCPFNDPEVLSSVLDKSNFFAEILTEYLILNSSNSSQLCFPWRHFSVIPKMDKKVITTLDSSQGPSPDFILVVVRLNCEPLLHISWPSPYLFQGILLVLVIGISHVWSLESVGERFLPKSTILQMNFLFSIKSLGNMSLIHFRLMFPFYTP